jgi:hypothetical protein
LFIEGSGKSNGTLFFDPTDGLPVAEESTLDLELTIAVTGQQNMTIPQTQSMKTTMVLLPQ